MILEALEYLLTPAPREARRMGLAYEAVAIGRRASRCRDAWAPHLGSSRAAIRRALEDVPGHFPVTVLGSGGLNDLDLADFGEDRKVCLVDIVHPLTARRKAARRPNTALVTEDVSGFLAPVLDWTSARSGTPTSPLPIPARDLQGLPPEPGLIVSLNLLSQIPLPVERLITRKKLSVDLDALTRTLMEAHLEGLQKTGAPVLLITDTERHYHQPGRTHMEEALAEGLDLPASEATWDWLIAPEGEARPYDRIVHKVAAFRLGT